MGGTSETMTTVFTAGVPDLGFDCLDQRMYCQGDTRDTVYPASKNFIAVGRLDELEKVQYKTTLLDNSSIYVVGINHKLLGVCRYASISLYDENDLKGIKARGDDDMEGSADFWLAGTEYAHLSKYLYAFEFNRNCGTRPSCVSVPATGVDEDLFIPYEHDLLFIERSYYDESTGVSPANESMIKPKILKSDGWFHGRLRR